MRVVPPRFISSSRAVIFPAELRQGKMVEEDNANAECGKSQDIKRVGADEDAETEGSGNKR